MTAGRPDPRVTSVDRAAALELLPEVYAEALRLRERGCGNAEIARQLSIAPEAAISTIELAEAKLAGLLRHDGDQPEPPRDGRTSQ
jgi:DNA-directed RNA polymerase specialized sigma24 family protein